MLHLVHAAAVVFGDDGGEVGSAGEEYISDTQMFQLLRQLHVGTDVEFGNRQMDHEGFFVLVPIAVLLEESRDFAGGEQFFRGNALVGEDQPHPAIIFQIQIYGTEIVAPVVSVIDQSLVHEFFGAVAVGAVEGGVGVMPFLELVLPLDPVIQGGSQGQHTPGVHLQILGLLLEQAAGLAVDPGAEGFVDFLAAQVALEHGSVILVRQKVHRFIIIIVSLFQPQGVCQDGGGQTVVVIVGLPYLFRLGPEVLDGVCAQKIQDLLAAVAVGGLSQHGQSHVDIHRGADCVAAVGIGKQCVGDGGKIRIKGVGVAVRLVVQRPLLFPPAVLAFGIVVGGVLDKGRIHGSGQEHGGVNAGEFDILRRCKGTDQTGCQYYQGQYRSHGCRQKPATALFGSGGFGDVLIADMVQSFA